MHKYIFYKPCLMFMVFIVQITTFRETEACPNSQKVSRKRNRPHSNELALPPWQETTLVLANLTELFEKDK